MTGHEHICNNVVNVINLAWRCGQIIIKHMIFELGKSNQIVPSISSNVRNEALIIVLAQLQQCVQIFFASSHSVSGSFFIRSDLANYS